MEKRIRILRLTESYIRDIGLSKKEVNQLKMLIDALESKKDLDIGTVIKGIEKIENNSKNEKKRLS